VLLAERTFHKKKGFLNIRREELCSRGLTPTYLTRHPSYVESKKFPEMTRVRLDGYALAATACTCFVNPGVHLGSNGKYLGH